MPKVIRVKKCRKSPGKCGRCGTTIEKGQPYLYWEFAYSPKSIRCAAPACSPKPKDLTRSAFWGTVYGIQEEKWDADNIDDMVSRKEDVVGQLEELRDEQEEKKSNMPDSLQDGATGEILQERYDALDGVINNLEGVDISWDEPEKEDDEEDDEFEARKTEELENRLSEIRTELEDALEDISCS